MCPSILKKTPRDMMMLLLYERRAPEVKTAGVTSRQGFSGPSQVQLSTHSRKMKAFNPEAFTCRLQWLRCHLNVRKLPRGRCCAGSGGKGAGYGFCKLTSLLFGSWLCSSLTTDLRVHRHVL